MGAVGWIIVGVLVALLVRVAAGTTATGGPRAWLAASVIGAVFGGAVASVVGLGSAAAIFSAGTWTLALAGALVGLGLRHAATSGALGIPELREREVRGHDR